MPFGSPRHGVCWAHWACEFAPPAMSFVLPPDSSFSTKIQLLGCPSPRTHCVKSSCFSPSSAPSADFISFPTEVWSQEGNGLAGNQQAMGGRRQRGESRCRAEVWAEGSERGDWTRLGRPPSGRKPPESRWGGGLCGICLVSSELLSTTSAGVDPREFFFPIIFLSGVAGQRVRQAAGRRKGTPGAHGRRGTFEHVCCMSTVLGGRGDLRGAEMYRMTRG